MIIILTLMIGSGIINPVVNQCFEDGRTQSNEYLTAAFIRSLIPGKRRRPPPVVIETKKQRKVSKEKEMKQKSKDQAAELKQTKHQLQVAELTARYQRGGSIQASELVGLKKKELALILGIEKYERKTLVQLQALIQSNDEKNANEIIEEDEEDSDEEADEDHEKEITNLILRLRRTPSGNHWEGGVFERSAPQENLANEDEDEDEDENEDNTNEASEELNKKDSEECILSITSKGFGKKSLASKYRTTNRGGVGVTNINITSKTIKKIGTLITALTVNQEDEVLLITSTGKMLRFKVSDIRNTSRNTSGVIIARLEKDEVIVSASVVISDGIEHNIE